MAITDLERLLKTIILVPAFDKLLLCLFNAKAAGSVPIRLNVYVADLVR
jgi:hypothetical protein